MGRSKKRYHHLDVSSQRRVIRKRLKESFSEIKRSGTETSNHSDTGMSSSDSCMINAGAESYVTITDETNKQTLVTSESLKCSTMVNEEDKSSIHPDIGMSSSDSCPDAGASSYVTITDKTSEPSLVTSESFQCFNKLSEEDKSGSGVEFSLSCDNAKNVPNIEDHNDDMIDYLNENSCFYDSEELQELLASLRLKMTADDLLSSENYYYAESNHSEDENEGYIGDIDSSDDKSESNHTQGKDATPSTEFPSEFPFSFESFQNDLSEWTIQHSIPRDHVDSLLRLLRKVPGLEKLPKSGKTLKRTPTNSGTKIKVLEDESGMYFHFSLRRCLEEILMAYPLLHTITEIMLLFNSDGISIFKSIGSELWPILCAIISIAALKDIIMPVGFFYSPKKPQSAKYLQDLVDELCVLLRDGLNINGQQINVYVKGWSCDAPATSLILGTVNFNGISQCIRCHIKGKNENNVTFYTAGVCRERTNDEFLDWTDKDFRRRETPLTQIPGLHFCRSFANDPMHLIFLGITRTFLSLLIIRKKQPNKLPAATISAMSANAVALRPYIPREFARKPRSFEELKRYKATELRLFVLYTAPIILEPFISKLRFIHFLCLHVSLRILFHPHATEDLEMIQYAEELLKSYVKTFEKEYGERYITHNFHGLLHLVEDLLFFGSLHDCSAFRFENFMQFVKSLISKNNLILSQIVNRMEEMSRAKILFRIKETLKEPKFIRKKSNRDLQEDEYEQVVFSHYRLTLQQPDNCCQLKDGRITKITNIFHNIETKSSYFLGNIFLTKKDFFVKPCKSSLIDIYEVDNLSNYKVQFSTESIAHKCVLMKTNNQLPSGGREQWVSYPMLHSTFDSFE